VISADIYASLYPEIVVQANFTIDGRKFTSFTARYDVFGSKMIRLKPGRKFIAGIF
jgi:hypothetical protein